MVHLHVYVVPLESVLELWHLMMIPRRLPFKSELKLRTLVCVNESKNISVVKYEKDHHIY